MRKLLIVYHTQSGASAQLAQALWRGALAEGSVAVRVCRACDAGTTELAEADALALVGAENAGAASGGLKEFLDRVFYPAIDRGLVVPYALVISAGNDGRGARDQIQRMLSGIPCPPAAEPLLLRGEPNESQLQDCRDLGQALSAGLGMGIF